MQLFEAFKIRDLEFRNRLAVSPMCQYSATDGLPNSWHLVHLGSRAVGGAGLVMTEATAVEARGRISPGDTGIYTDAQAEAWQPVTRFIREEGAVPAIQLAHAGRKASTNLPWKGGKPLTGATGGWDNLTAPSALPFDEGFAVPQAMSVDEIHATTLMFVRAAERSLVAGFEVAEVHAAHGYLFHEFLSPLTNLRQDEYGGPFEGRTRFLRETVAAVRRVWPQKWPLFVRISASDWVAGGWGIEESVALCRELKALGADLIDVSSGGNVATAKIPLVPGYQVPFAAQIRRDAQVATGAVGLITEARQAQEILDRNEADMIFMAREFLRDPYWARRAAKELGQKITGPKQYGRAW